MYTEITDVVTLATYGNAFLAGSPAFDPAAFHANNTAFRHAEYCRFADGATILAPDPPAWFQWLREQGTRALRIHRIASTGRWLIESAGTAGSDFWQGSSETGDTKRPDQKYQRKTYSRTAKGKATAAVPMADPEKLKAEMTETLRGLVEFARSQKSGFEKAFANGLASIGSDVPEKGPWLADITPPGALSLTARQLLGAAQASWVFGGMGSWNDQDFGPDGAAGERLGQKLYDQIYAAMLTAVNASAPKI